MSNSAPTHDLPRYVNPRKCAVSSVQLSGKLDTEQLLNLPQAVTRCVSMQADLQFFLNDAGKVCLSGRVAAVLELPCQRCLQTINDYPVTTELALAVVSDETQAKHLPKNLDPWILPEADGDVYALIEEEILLALPVVAYHPYECVDPSLYSCGDTASEHDAAEASPFQALAALKAKPTPQ